MRRWKMAVVGVLLAVMMTGCAGAPPEVVPGPSAPEIEAPAPVPPPTVQVPPPAPPPRTDGPAVVADGDDLRLTGLGSFDWLGWAPDGRTGLLRTSAGIYALRPEQPSLDLLIDWGWAEFQGWAGPTEAVLIKGGPAQVLGLLSAETGAWRPVAALAGLARVQVCMNGANLLWVDVRESRSGGAWSRDSGRVYRTPAPWSADAPAPLEGELLLERAALLGRLADGSCLLDESDRRLLLLRPGGDLVTLSEEFLIPQVTQDGRGVIWREEAGPCPECIELGQGVPFQRLVWWRLDGGRLTADLGQPWVLSPLLSPDGQKMAIGSREFGGMVGAIGVLDADGFRPGEVREKALVPVGWLGSDLLASPAGPERWRDRSPIFRVEDGAKVAEVISQRFDGSLLIEMGGEHWYLPAGGPAFRVRNLGDGVELAGTYQAEAAYAVVRKGDSAWLLRLQSE